MADIVHISKKPGAELLDYGKVNKIICDARQARVLVAARVFNNSDESRVLEVAIEALEQYQMSIGGLPRLQFVEVQKATAFDQTHQDEQKKSFLEKL